MPQGKEKTGVAELSQNWVDRPLQPFPLGEVIGLRFEDAVDGVVSGSFQVAPVHLNPNGVVHGAALFALIDTLMGLASMSVLPPGSKCSTVDLHVRYLRPVRAGVVTGLVEVIHQGRRLISLSGELRGEEGLVASATGAFAITPGEVAR